MAESVENKVKEWNRDKNYLIEVVGSNPNLVLIGENRKSKSHSKQTESQRELCAILKPEYLFQQDGCEIYDPSTNRRVLLDGIVDEEETIDQTSHRSRWEENTAFLSGAKLIGCGLWGREAEKYDVTDRASKREFDYELANRMAHRIIQYKDKTRNPLMAITDSLRLIHSKKRSNSPSPQTTLDAFEVPYVLIDQDIPNPDR